MEHRLYRKATDFDVSLTTRMGEMHATVTNVHPYGARLRLLSDHGDLSTTVVLDLNGKGHAAQVMWQHETDVGVRFVTPLDVETVAMVARKIGGASRERLVRELTAVRSGDEVDAHLPE